MILACLQASKPSKYCQLIYDGCLSAMIQWLHHDQAILLVERMLKPFRGRGKDYRAEVGLAKALATAARKGNFPVVLNLLGFTDLATTTLASAVRGRNQDLVFHLLGVGAKAHEGEDWSNNPLNLDDEILSSPFGEAILAKDDHLKILLEKSGALKGMEEELLPSVARCVWYSKKRTRFQSAINAASKIGDVFLVREYLRIFHKVRADEKYIGKALLTAIESDQIEICRLLLESGADVHMLCKFSGELRTTLTLALQKKHSFVVRKLLEANVSTQYNGSDFSGDRTAEVYLGKKTTAIELAVEWVDHCLIGDLIDINAANSSAA